MTAHQPISAPVFPADTLAAMAALYPLKAGLLRHHLPDHPLLSIEALAELAESMPASAVEYNPGNVPIGIRPEDVPSNGLSIGETIRTIDTNGSWAVLKNIENVPAYRTLLMDLLGELKSVVEPRTGAMLTPQGFIFISSPDAVTPYHFDPEHNILLQIRGSKVMTQFPAGDTRFVPDQAHETYHSGGPRELKWDDAMLAHGREFQLSPGDALFVPVMAPHFVKNGPAPSVSLSITWRSEWSYRESDARILNAILRKRGFSPAAPRRWPQQNYTKAYTFRALRKLGLTGK